MERVYVSPTLELQGLTVVGYTPTVSLEESPAMVAPVLVNAQGHQVRLQSPLGRRAYTAVIDPGGVPYTPIPVPMKAIEGHGVLVMGYRRPEHAEVLRERTDDPLSFCATWGGGGGQPWQAVGPSLWATVASDAHIEWMMDAVRKAARTEVRRAYRAKDETRLAQGAAWLAAADWYGEDADLVAVCMPNPDAWLQTQPGYRDPVKRRDAIERGKSKRTKKV